MTDINISDYISEERKKEIAEEVFERECLEKFRTDNERIFSNAAYYTTKNMVKESMGDSLDAIITDKVLELIKNLPNHTVFSAPDVWTKQSTGGFDAIKTAIHNNKDLIDSRIKELISDVDTMDVRDQIQDAVHAVLINALPDKG